VAPYYKKRRHSNPYLSSRPRSNQAIAELELKGLKYIFILGVIERLIVDFDVPKMALDILGPNDQVYKNGYLPTAGIGAGKYDAFHKQNRQLWRQATTRIIGRDRMHEIAMSVAIQVCDALEDSCKTAPNNAIEPGEILMNGTLKKGLIFKKSKILIMSVLGRASIFRVNVCQASSG